MAANKKLLVLPGDGIGPEVMRETRRVIDWLGRRRGMVFEIEEGLVGGAAIDAEGTPCSNATVARAKAADAVLFGSVGGPKWDGLPFEQRPELGILRLRKELGLFANLRPAVVFDALADASSLKPDVVRGVDIMVVRESTGGIYFGEPRGIETLPDGKRRGFDTDVYHEDEIARVARIAFDLARKRRNKVTSVEKANVMQSGRLWRAVVGEVQKAEFPDVQLENMYADNCAMQLCSRPKQFDVILGSNLFGDVLSDLAAALTGSLGMLPPRRSAKSIPSPANGMRSMSRSMARRRTLPARASPIPRRRSSPLPCCCAGPSASRTRPGCCKWRSRRCWAVGSAPRTSCSPAWPASAPA